MNILLSAFSFEPIESSEPGVAWRFAQIAAQSHRVWVLTADFPTTVARTKVFLEQYPDKNITVVPFWPRGIARTDNGERVNLQYWLWQRQVLGVARHLHSVYDFSLVHQVTFSRYWTPSSLCLLPTPFVWGPVGSAESTPRAFLRTLKPRDRMQSMFRDLSRKISEFDPLLRSCARHSAATFATTNEALKRVKKLGARRAELLPQVFFSKERLDHFARVKEPKSTLPLRMLSIGRSLYWKGFQYGLETAAILKRRGISFTYTIVGTGPFAADLRRKAESLGIADQTVFIPRFEGDIATILSESHVLIHPALHETFGNVCLEALAAGRPVICLDVGGPATQVTHKCGLVATVESPELAVLMMADKLSEIANKPDCWRKMSDAAKQRAATSFAMDSVADTISRTYARIAA